MCPLLKGIPSGHEALGATAWNHLTLLWFMKLKWSVWNTIRNKMSSIFPATESPTNLSEDQPRAEKVTIPAQWDSLEGWPGNMTSVYYSTFYKEGISLGLGPAWPLNKSKAGASVVVHSLLRMRNERITNFMVLRNMLPNKLEGVKSVSSETLL